MVLLTAHTYIELKGNAHEEEVSRHNRACRHLDPPSGLPTPSDILPKHERTTYGWLNPLLAPRHKNGYLLY